MKPWETEPHVTALVAFYGVAGAIATVWMLFDMGVL